MSKCTEVEISDTLHKKNSENGFDVCYIRSDDEYGNRCYLGRKVSKEESAWNIVNDMSKGNMPCYYAMIYVVYFSDIEGKKTPVLGFRKKAFIG